MTCCRDVLALLCAACGAEVRILAFLTDPPVVSAILLHLDSAPICLATPLMELANG